VAEAPEIGMQEKEISQQQAGLLIDNLMRKSVPVLAVFNTGIGPVMKLYGHISSVTGDVGVVVSMSPESPAYSSTMTVPLGNPAGNGCKFFVGSAPDEDLRLKYGSTVLRIDPPSGGRLMLFFTEKEN
jgi:hypothetical protein